MQLLNRAPFVLIAALCWLVACPGDPEPPGPTSTESFTEPPDPQLIRDVETVCHTSDGDHADCILNIPLDQLVVMMHTGLDFDRGYKSLGQTLQELNAEGIAASLVGQIPPINVLQVRIEHEDLQAPVDQDAAQRAFGRLKRAQEVIAANPDVLSVTFNWPMEYREGMEPDDDNANRNNVPSEQRAGLAAIDYYQAVPIFDDVFGDRSALAPVRVGILDTGLGLDTGQFDNIEVVTVSKHPTKTDSNGHGTGVAGLIAADNGDGFVNGIASRILNGPHGSKGQNALSIAVPGSELTLPCHVQALHALVDLLVHTEPDIVNISLGYNRYSIRELNENQELTPLSELQVADARRQWREALSGAHPRCPIAAETLFVCAVANQNYLLSESDFPAGLALKNVISVGVVDSEELFFRLPGSGYGSRITVLAPGTKIPILSRSKGGAVTVENIYGTSYATAMVTSMAAIMYAVSPPSGPEEIKRFFQSPANSWKADPNAGGRRVALIKTVGSYILEKTKMGSSVLDSFAGGDGDPDPSGYIMGRHFSNATSTVEITNAENGSVLREAFQEPEFDRIRMSFINNSGGLSANGIVTYNANVSNHHVSALLVSQPPIFPSTYKISDAGPALSLLRIGAENGGMDYSGIGKSGNLWLTECEITTRSLPLHNNFMDDVLTLGLDAFTFVQMRGSFDATIHGEYTSNKQAIFGVTSTFDTVFVLVNLSEEGADLLETFCIGGYNY